MSSLATIADAPPTLSAPAVVGHGVVETAGPGGPTASAATLELGSLRVTCTDGVEVVRAAAWLRDAGDGRDPIDVVLRPGGTAVTVTWRDGRRTRFGVGALRA